ncbi:MAG: phosphoenolpyruvate synthase [Gammaproteobacteria bacterium]|nr:phosphoenolpyruvate synthase [Gammaproteobacteria bacterium]
MRFWLAAATTILMAGTAAFAGEAVDTAASGRLDVEGMKASSRGPFQRIRWFCKDGSILEPQPYGCKEHGGGSQHGQWSDTTTRLRDAGFYIANVYADLDIEALLAGDPVGERLGQMLVEQFLIERDDGWILRRAQFYRGAFQEEGERAGKERLLRELLARPAWLDERYLGLRTAARLLPHGRETATVREIRQEAAALTALNPAFSNLRNKIHGQPGSEDATSVRAFAAQVDDADMRSRLQALAANIDGVYAMPVMQRFEQAGSADLGSESINAAAAAAQRRLRGTPDDATVFEATGQLLAEIRSAMPQIGNLRSRLRLLDFSLVVEDIHFTAGQSLANDATSPRTLTTQLALLAAAADGLYGAGLVSNRQWLALRDSLASLERSSVDLLSYKRTLQYLALAPSWGTQRYRFLFQEAVDKLAEIEPLAHQFIPDQLRGGPMFAYARLSDQLLRDANLRAGIVNELFSDAVGAGLRALNPGLARGRLHLVAPHEVEGFDPKGIYLLAETISELPPVAGILTQGEGNPLSHVQLLARNLGIPNVAIDQQLLSRLTPYDGVDIIMAVSPGGSVRLMVDHGELAALFDESTEAAALIEPDLVKLDIANRSLLPLARLRESDSGRAVGPKAAKLGELMHHYPEAVAPGLAIPFGIFRELLEQPAPESPDESIWTWMVRNYRTLEAMPADGVERRAATERFRAQLYAAVLTTPLADTFRAELAQQMNAAFGTDGAYGVFVRSDTNVEDLPGFTGAGLNLTVPNVVGFDNVVAAISRVWASPFTARAFAWRQSHMRQPELVFPAVLLMASVNSAKSGVLVTSDIDTGDRNWISVAVNEGVGGAVDGQSAESLRINIETGQVRVLTDATAVWRRQIDPAGGVARLPVSGDMAVLKPDEVAALIAFAHELPQRFPPIVDADGNPAPADVEFGFENGQLRLFQLRPFLDSKQARGSTYLHTLDVSQEALAQSVVNLESELEHL